MNWYSKIFAKKYDSFVGNLEVDFGPIRQQIIGNLEGKILDIGAGTGANFHYFSQSAEVLAIEPSIYMIEKAKEKFPDIKNIQLLHFGVNDPELNKFIPEKSQDFIVCTLVLCTVDNPIKALHQFKKWLKPNGKLIVLEHIHSEKKVNRVLQNFLNPLWKKVGDGCNLNRDTDQMIKNVGFELVHEKYFKRSLRFYQAEFLNHTN